MRPLMHHSAAKAGRLSYILGAQLPQAGHLRSGPTRMLCPVVGHQRAVCSSGPGTLRIVLSDTGSAMIGKVSESTDVLTERRLLRRRVLAARSASVVFRLRLPDVREL